MLNDKYIRFEDIDDGHLPGGGSASTLGTKLAVNAHKANLNFMSIFDDLVPEEVWRTRAYSYAVEKKRPWGVYILGDEALDLSIDPEALYQSGDHEKAIALRYLRALVYERAEALITKDFPRIHGTVVWCLSSGITNSVEYHIDYAELYRYETNIIHPPLYAGTAHLSPPEVMMKGGHFMVNTKGIDHYRKFGYKARKQPGLQDDIDGNEDGSWIRVPYRYNRGILHDGDFPHLSTPVDSIDPIGRRVILGFNCFTKEVGPCCLRAPEHSDAFNRTVRLYQTLASVQGGGGVINGKYSGESTGRPSCNPVATTSAEKKKSTVTVQDIKKNPALAKLLIAAAKKVKEANK